MILKLNETIIKALHKKAEEINNIGHGEVKIIIQDGKAIRLETTLKEKI